MTDPKIRLSRKPAVRSLVVSAETAAADAKRWRKAAAEVAANAPYIHDAMTEYQRLVSLADAAERAARAALDQAGSLVAA